MQFINFYEFGFFVDIIVIAFYNCIINTKMNTEIMQYREGKVEPPHYLLYIT